MTTTHGFTLVRETMIAELNTMARIWRHEKTGAQLLSMENDDENKCFGIVFRTPPTDSTGIAHIMEHAVLAGSRKYPLKEPFIHLVKGSLKTFLNAMTFPDRTAYPVASTNLQDFYNLVDVYLDAVFHPLITRHHLDQEGWHYELEQLDQPLAFRGVVFNEMKGAYSSPEMLLYRQSGRSLFPDTAYGFDSGGDPAEIPNLTYEQFKAFHATYYHPSNALIYFYGDDDPTERLRLLDDYLRHFEPIPVDGHVALQPSFAEPKQLIFPYGVDPGADTAKKTMLQLNWLLPDTSDVALLMGLDLLSDAIIGTQASPLRKALVDSGLGDDVTGGGLGVGLRQMTFAAGLKGIKREDANKVETLIMTTLEQLAADGIDPATVEAALNSTEFALRENNTGSFPRGLSLLFRALTTWNYNGDPLAPLAYESLLAQLKANLAANPAYLQQLIRTYLLENPHRTTVILEPDPAYNQRLAEAEQARLAAARSAMNEAELQAIIENTRKLKQLQEAPDDPAAVAALPSLKLNDLDKQVKTIPSEVMQSEGSEILYHDLFTNGIVYLDLALNLQTLPQTLLPYVGLFGRALTEMGTEAEDYVQLSQRIGRRTGGVYATTMVSAVQNQPEAAAWFVVRGKATMPQAQELLAILHDVLHTVKLDNPERFRQIVLKMRSRAEASLIPAGNSYVAGRLRAAFTQADWAEEQMGGISNLFFLRQLEKEIDDDWAGVLARLEAVRGHLFNRNNLLANVTLDSANWAKFEPQLEGFLAAAPADHAVRPGWAATFDPANEGLTIPAQVNYVGKGANLYSLGYRHHGSISVIANFIRTGWLWEKVRMQGGAYGASCGFSKQSGVWTFTSYRDPNLRNTLEVYDQTAAVLRNTTLSDDELTKSIIGAIGAMDAYQLPDAKGYTAMARYLLGESDAARQQTRDEIMSTSLADFRRFADLLAEVNTHGRVVVMGSPGAIEAANETGWLQVQKVL